MKSLPPQIYNKLAPVPGLNVWRRGEVPRELHYNRNPALPDLIVSAKKGECRGDQVKTA